VTAPEENQLLGFILSSVQRLDRLEEVDVPKANYNEFVVLFGLIAQTHRFSNGFLRLRAKGLGREGHALIRGALEHAITAQSAYLTPDGAKHLHERFQLRHRNYWTSMGAAMSSDEIRATVAAMPPIEAVQEGANFTKHVLKPLDTDGFLAGIYDSLGLVLHPTHAVYDLVSADDGAIVLNHGRGDAHLDYFGVHAGAVSCMLARWVLARLLNDSAELLALDSLSDELEIPVRLDHQLPREQRRFPDEI
jgi:hypothetical protein